MNTQELNDLLANAEVAKVSHRSNYRPIRSRRYNVEVVKNGKIIETIPWIATMAKAKEIAAEYRKDGARCNIIEDCTFNNKWDEIKFTQKPEVNIPTGRMTFRTPEMTPNRIAMKKALKSIPRPKLDENAHAWRIADPEHMPGTQMHEAWLRTVAKNGYTVKRDGDIIFMGLQKEVSEFLYEYLKANKLTVKDVEVIYHGS